MSDGNYSFKVHSLDRSQLVSISILNNFSVTTTSGTINVTWGDGTSDVITSNTPVFHNFLLSQNLLGGFWNFIDISEVYTILPKPVFKVHTLADTAAANVPFVVKPSNLLSVTKPVNLPTDSFPSVPTSPTPTPTPTVTPTPTPTVTPTVTPTP
jgi:hypothetical protein